MSVKAEQRQRSSTAHIRKLLVVEDDPGLQSQLRWCFEDYDVIIAGDRNNALEQVKNFRPPVVTLDLGLPPDEDGSTEGLAAVREILKEAPDTKVIVVTGNDDLDNAVTAVGVGAYDFYHKPIDPEILGLIVNRAYRLYELEAENRRLAATKSMAPVDGIVACSAEMHRVCSQIEKVAPANATVLLRGESGTGKELCARALHSKGARTDKRFVAINCAAIPENLLESELFGYEKGAYTGAIRQTQGKIEYADGGTLFLDEVGDLPMPLQAKLLRFLQERVVERIGGRQEIPVDVRVVCATHQDLEKKITNGSFREDLYYRISEVVIQIPPLRERQGDIMLLARSFLDQSNHEHQRRIRSFSKDAVMALEGHFWPGNVRELKNRIKRAVIMADGKQITARDIELDSGEQEGAEQGLSLRQARERAEREAILRAMAQTGGNVAQAAELLGISRPTMYDLMRKLDLKI